MIEFFFNISSEFSNANPLYDIKEIPVFSVPSADSIIPAFDRFILVFDRFTSASIPVTGTPPSPHLLEITYFPWTHKSKTFPNYRAWQKLAKCCKYHAEYTIWHRCGTNESGCIYLMKTFPTAWLVIFRRNAFCAHISNGNLLVYNSNFTFEIRIGAMRHVAATMRELPLEQTPTNLINRLNPLKNLSIWAPFHKRLFHRNSNSTEISFHSHLDSNSVIATKFCTWHDSCAVVAFAKMCCDLMASNGITARRRFHRILFAGKKSLVTRAPVWTRIYH